MDTTLKYQLIEKIVRTNDEAVLREIKALLESAAGDWWETSSEAERASIERGVEQADRGEVVPHAQAWGQVLANRKKRS